MNRIGRGAVRVEVQPTSFHDHCVWEEQRPWPCLHKDVQPHCFRLWAFHLFSTACSSHQFNA